ALSIPDVLKKMVVNPRNVLHLPIPEIKIGEPANLTIFDPALKWIFEKRHVKSRSINSPYLGSGLVGKALGIYNKGRFVWNGRD
ncbi:MAG TPA: hypothetical protein VKA08_07495, partial [Balneolales bacterium]|nr:hypothetical protein [Balneolales bacterium]